MANQVGKKYTYERCGAIYMVSKAGKGELVCCGQPRQIKKRNDIYSMILK